MFLIDHTTAANGERVVRERPVCTECVKAFDATPKEIAQFKLEKPRTIVVCRACLMLLCGPPITLRKQRRAIAV